MGVLRVRTIAYLGSISLVAKLADRLLDVLWLRRIEVMKGEGDEASPTKVEHTPPQHYNSPPCSSTQTRLPASSQIMAMQRYSRAHLTSVDLPSQRREHLGRLAQVYHTHQPTPTYLSKALLLYLFFLHFLVPVLASALFVCCLVIQNDHYCRAESRKPCRRSSQVAFHPVIAPLLPLQ
jgi:hypothetical protein